MISEIKFSAFTIHKISCRTIEYLFITTLLKWRGGKLMILGWDLGVRWNTDNFIFHQTKY